MSAQAFQPEVLQMAIEDHEILSQFIENVDKLFSGKPADDVKEAVETIALILNKKILDHFAYEEDHVFAALTTSQPTPTAARLIPELCREHQTILAKARQLNSRLAPTKPAGDAGQLRQELSEFVSDLEDHAAKEDELFHALLEAPC